jgi:hypothetical protein
MFLDLATFGIFTANFKDHFFYTITAKFFEYFSLLGTPPPVYRKLMVPRLEVDHFVECNYDDC